MLQLEFLARVKLVIPLAPSVSISTSTGLRAFAARDTESLKSVLDLNFVRSKRELGSCLNMLDKLPINSPSQAQR